MFSTRSMQVHASNVVLVPVSVCAPARCRTSAPAMKHLLRLGAVALGLLSCRSQPVDPPDAHLEQLHGRIREVYGPDGEGSYGLAIGPYQRVFRIHPDYSPDASSLVALAQRLSGTDKSVRATIWTRDPAVGKANPEGSGVPGPAWVVIRLVEDE